MTQESYEDFKFPYLIVGEYGRMCAYLTEDEDGLLVINLEEKGEWPKFSEMAVKRIYSELIEKYAGTGDLGGFCEELKKSIKHFIQ